MSIDLVSNEECMLDDETEAIYKSSPFYKDFKHILDEAMQKWTSVGKDTEIEFLQYIIKHYFSMLPFISAILVPIKTSHPQVSSKIRFSNAYAESYFSMLKEMLRRMENRIGKLPIRVDVLVKILKQNVLAAVLRFGKQIPRGRKITVTKQIEMRTTDDDVKLNDELQHKLFETPKTSKCYRDKTDDYSVTKKDIDNSVSKWKRAAKAETPPNSPSLPRKKIARKMFESKIGCIVNVVCDVVINGITYYLPVEIEHLSEQLQPTEFCIIPEDITAERYKTKLWNQFYPNSAYYEKSWPEENLSLGYLNLAGEIIKV